MVTGSYKSYLQKKADIYDRLDDFLRQGPTAATPWNLSEIVGADDVLRARLQDVVFHEEGAKLVGPNGKPPKW